MRKKLRLLTLQLLYLVNSKIIQTKTEQNIIEIVPLLGCLVGSIQNNLIKNQYFSDQVFNILKINCSPVKKSMNIYIFHKPPIFASHCLIVQINHGCCLYNIDTSSSSMILSHLYLTHTKVKDVYYECLRFVWDLFWDSILIKLRSILRFHFTRLLRTAGILACHFVRQS